MNWLDIVKKYGVDFAYENAEGNIEIKPVDEWLDDVYLRLSAKNEQDVCRPFLPQLNLLHLNRSLYLK